MGRGHLRTSPALLVLRERAFTAATILALLVALGWWTATGTDRRMERCLSAYGRAHTSTDSAKVDLLPLSGRSRSTCGNLRRAGTLDRHRAARG